MWLLTALFLPTPPSLVQGLCSFWSCAGLEEMIQKGLGAWTEQLATTMIRAGSLEDPEFGLKHQKCVTVGCLYWKHPILWHYLNWYPEDFCQEQWHCLSEKGCLSGV